MTKPLFLFFVVATAKKQRKIEKWSGYVTLKTKHFDYKGGCVIAYKKLFHKRLNYSYTAIYTHNLADYTIMNLPSLYKISLSYKVLKTGLFQTHKQTFVVSMVMWYTVGEVQL